MVLTDIMIRKSARKEVLITYPVTLINHWLRGDVWLDIYVVVGIVVWQYKADCSLPER